MKCTYALFSDFTRTIAYIISIAFLFRTLFHDTQACVFFNITMTMTIGNPSNSSSIFISIFIGICLSLIALITALGSIVVLLPFYCDNKLRTVNGIRFNIFFIN